MLTSIEVCRLVHGVTVEQLQQWTARAWIAPARHGTDYLFAEIDVARVQLIHEMTEALAVDEEAVPVVLSLVDQVYGLRRSLRRICAAIEAQPEPVRTRILESIRAPQREP